jgi:hypothetical protein
MQTVVVQSDCKRRHAQVNGDDSTAIQPGGARQVYALWRSTCWQHASMNKDTKAGTVKLTLHKAAKEWAK